MQKWFSVSQVSQLAGVSVRTLHHYDQIGLLTPLRQQDNGYRCYCEQHLVKLQQILLYRQLDFSLEQIRDMMQAPDFDAVSALQQQHALLLSKLDATQQMINNNIEVAMTIQRRSSRCYGPPGISGAVNSAGSCSDFCLPVPVSAVKRVT